MSRWFMEQLAGDDDDVDQYGMDALARKRLNVKAKSERPGKKKVVKPMRSRLPRSLAKVESTLRHRGYLGEKMDDVFASGKRTLDKGSAAEKKELARLDKELSDLEGRTSWGNKGAFDLTKDEMAKVRNSRKVKAALKKRREAYKKLSGDWSLWSKIQKRKAEIAAYKVYLDELQKAEKHKKKYGYI